MYYPKSLDVLYKAVPAAAKKFGVSEQYALFQLVIVALRSEDVRHTLRAIEGIDAAAAGLLDGHESAAQRGDPVITCELCQDDQWWKDNYGSVWEWAQWWYCGPFGLNCNGE